MHICFYDLETTGLPKPGNDPLQQPGITQIGAVIVDVKNWHTIGAFNQFCNPELPRDRWEAGAIKATGITPERVADSPSFFTVGLSFANFVLGCSHLSGYNILGFDNNILLWQLKRYGMEMNFPWPPNHVDIMQIVKKSGEYVGSRGPKAPKLGVLYKDLFEEEMENAHDALADVTATARIARKIAPFAFGYEEPSVASHSTGMEDSGGSQGK